MIEFRLTGVDGATFVRGVPTGFDEVAASETAGAVPELTPKVARLASISEKVSLNAVSSQKLLSLSS